MTDKNIHFSLVRRCLIKENQTLKVVLAADRAGYPLKSISRIIGGKRNSLRGYGLYDQEPVDYPDLAFQAAQAVQRGDFTRIIIWVRPRRAIVNKLRGIRAALWRFVFCRYARAHNDINILTLGVRVLQKSWPKSSIFLRPFEGKALNKGGKNQKLEERAGNNGCSSGREEVSD